MKNTRTFLLVLFSVLAISVAQTAMAQMAPAAQAGAHADVYHVYFVKAALGKAAALGDFLKTPDPKAPMPGHFLLLRHQEGDSWDYVVIEHLGVKATVESGGSPQPEYAPGLSDWHNDTFVSGPSWPEFTKAMGMGDDAAKSAGGVYIVSVFRAAAGHRAQLEKSLAAGQGGAVGSVMLTHLEGAPWQYLRIERYASWQELAASESKGIPDTAKPGSPWMQLREDAAMHNDTIADRIFP
jgi:hypothetical protein